MQTDHLLVALVSSLAPADSHNAGACVPFTQFVQSG